MFIVLLAVPDSLDEEHDDERENEFIERLEVDLLEVDFAELAVSQPLLTDPTAWPDSWRPKPNRPRVRRWPGGRTGRRAAAGLSRLIATQERTKKREVSGC